MLVSALLLIARSLLSVHSFLDFGFLFDIDECFLFTLSLAKLLLITFLLSLRPGVSTILAFQPCEKLTARVGY